MLSRFISLFLAFSIVCENTAGAFVQFDEGFTITAPNTAFQSAFQRIIKKMKDKSTKKHNLGNMSVPIINNLLNTPTHNLGDTIVEGFKNTVNTISDVASVLNSNNPIANLIGKTGIGQIGIQKNASKTESIHTVPVPTEMDSGGSGVVNSDNVSVNNLKLNLENDLTWNVKNLKLQDDKETFEFKHSGKGDSINTDLLAPIVNMMEGNLPIPSVTFGKSNTNVNHKESKSHPTQINMGGRHQFNNEKLLAKGVQSESGTLGINTKEGLIESVTDDLSHTEVGKSGSVTLGLNLGFGAKKTKKTRNRKFVEEPTYFKSKEGGSLNIEKLVNKGGQIWDESNNLKVNVQDLKLEDIEEYDLNKESKIGFGVSLGSRIPVSFDFGKRRKKERSTLHGTIGKTTEESREKKKTQKSGFRVFVPVVDVEGLVSDVKTIKQAVTRTFERTQVLEQKEIEEVLQDKDVVKVLEALEVVQQKVEKSPPISPRSVKRPVLSEEEIKLNTGDEILDRNVPEVIGTDSISVIVLESALNELEKASPNKTGSIALATQQIIAGTKAVLQDIRENPREYAKDALVSFIPFGEQGEKILKGEEVTKQEMLFELGLTVLPVGKIGKFLKKSGGRALKVFAKAMMKAKELETVTTSLIKEIGKKKLISKNSSKKIKEIEGKNKEQPWTVREGQEWKEKIFGKAQKTGTDGHDVRSYKEAIKLAKNENVEKVFLNRGLKKATNHPIKPNTRPDVTAVTKDGKVNQIEVPSKTDKRKDLMNRMDEAKQKLPENMQGKIETIDINKGNK